MLTFLYFINTSINKLFKILVSYMKYFLFSCKVFALVFVFSLSGRTAHESSAEYCAHYVNEHIGELCAGYYDLGVEAANSAFTDGQLIALGWFSAGVAVTGLAVACGVVPSSVANSLTNQVGHISRFYTHTSSALNKCILCLKKGASGIRLINKINQNIDDSILDDFPHDLTAQYKDIIKNRKQNHEALWELFNRKAIVPHDIQVDELPDLLLGDTCVYLPKSHQVFFGVDDTGWVKDYIIPDVKRLVLRLAKYKIETLSPAMKKRLQDSMYSEINNICKKVNQHGFNGSPEHDPRILQLWLSAQMESAWEQIENGLPPAIENEDV